MTSVIWKLTVDRPDDLGRSFVELPYGAKILSAGFQGDDIVVWARLDSDRTGLLNERRQLIIVNTGQKVDIPRYSTFVATVAHPVHGTVWHIFEGDS